MADQPGYEGPRGKIPGFYFGLSLTQELPDHRKGKYFLVPKSGVLPASHASSAESYRAMEEISKDMQDHQKVLQSNVGRIRRQNYSSLQADLCGREINLRFDMFDMVARQHHFLHQFECILLHGRNGRVNFRQPYNPYRQPKPFPRLNASDKSGFSVFDVSMKHNSLLWTSDDYEPSTLLMSDLDNRNTYDEQNDRAWLQKPVYVYDGNGRLGTTDIHHETGMVLTTWEDARTGHNVHFTTLEGRGSLVAGSSHHTRVEEDERTHEPKYHITAVATGNPSNKYAFMLGGNGKMITAVDKQGGFSAVQRDEGERAQNEAFAIEMLEDDPNLFVVGQRSGLFRVFDDREDNINNNNCVHRAQHVSSICKIKDMGVSKFVISGLVHTMSVYDLRYMAKANSKTFDVDKLANCPPLAQAGLRQRERYSIPVCHMPDHRNKFTRKADVAVDRGTRIVAAAQHDNYMSLVKFFDMDTGKQVGVDTKGLTSSNPHVSTCIRWVDEGDEGENRLKALWFSKGPSLYACRPGGGDDMIDCGT